MPQSNPERERLNVAGVMFGKCWFDDVKTSSRLVDADVGSFFAPEKEVSSFSLRVSNYEVSNRV